MKKIILIVLCAMMVNVQTACSYFSQSHRDFTFYQAKESILELSRVYITWDESISHMNIEVKETISGEKLAPALQSLCELPCTNSPFEPHDTPYGECFIIEYADGSYQLLDKYCNNYYNPENELLDAEYLTFHDEEFFSLWKNGLDASDN